ncbi:MAG: hypothetical protein AABZ06_00005 [Bdellovibrionota bacterium]
MFQLDELVLEDKKVPVLADKASASLKAAGEVRSETSKLQFIEFQNIEAVAYVAQRLKHCILAIAVTKEVDVTSIASSMQNLKKRIAKGHIRVVVMCSIQSTGVIAKLKAVGCNEIITEPIETNVLISKLERHAFLLAESAESDETSLASWRKAEKKIKASNRKQNIVNADVKKGRGGVEFIEPLNTGFDCWSFAAGSRARKMGGRWVVQLKGPPPALGQWSELEIEDRASEDDISWKWQPFEGATGLFGERPGFWAFIGNKPYYRDGMWTFIGKQPELAYYDSDDQDEFKLVARKIVVDFSGTLCVARNSDSTRDMLNKISKFMQNMTNRAKQFDGGEGDRGMGSDQRQWRYQQQIASDVIYADPLVIESDCWFLEDRKPVMVMNKWAVRLAGPGPSDGQWVRVEGVAINELMWRWEPDIGNGSLYIKEEGCWMFSGLLPRFEDGLWLFIGEKPKLSFIYEEHDYGSKISCDESGVLRLAVDSDGAKKILAAINASRNKVIRRDSSTYDVDNSTVLEAGDRVIITNNTDEQHVLENAATVFSPMAAAFILSELARQKELTLEEAGRRFCNHVSISCHGCLTELWIKTSDGWSFASGSGEPDGKWQQAQGKDWISVNIYQDGEVMGALCVEDSHKSTDKKAAYVDAVAGIVKGLLISLVADEAAAA